MTGSATAIPWWQAEPTRFTKDQREIEATFPDLTLALEGEGHWIGRLPIWPFERSEPPGVPDLLGGRGLLVHLSYSAAYPIVSPYLVPLDPEPLPEELTQTRWHVLGNKALCLFQTQADWDPATSVVDLLLKAAGWRIEYALLKAGARTDMTMAGIVHDDSLDGLIADTAQTLTKPDHQGTRPDASDNAEDSDS